LIYYFYLSKYISISGFADLNLEENGTNRWVAEPQMNIRLSDNVDLVLEGRLNEFESANPNLDGSGVAGGLKYKF